MPLAVPRPWRAAALAVAAVALGAAGPATAKTTFVNSAAGLRDALAGAQPGDEFVWRGGTYTNQAVVFEAQGAPGAPVTLRAETPGGVTFRGISTLGLGGRHLVVEGFLFTGGGAGLSVISTRAASDVARHAHDSVVRHCAVVNHDASNGATSSKWLQLYGRRNTVEHCLFAGKKTLGTAFVVELNDPPNDLPAEHVVRRNVFAHRPPGPDNGYETVRVGFSGHSLQNARCLFEENYFYRCDGEAEIISNKACENTYRRNVFVECRGALTLRHGDRCVVDSNWFFGGGLAETGGIRLVGAGHRVVNNYLEGLRGTDFRAALAFMAAVPDSPLNGYAQVEGAVVAHNTLVDCREGLALAVGLGSSGRTLRPRDSVVANNLFFLGDGQNAARAYGEPEDFAFAGNLRAGGSAGWTFPAGAFLPGSPALARAADGVLRPPADGPQRAVAASLAAPPALDADGQPRALPADVGADELSAAPEAFRPRAPFSEVGPAWLSAPARWQPRLDGASGPALRFRPGAWAVLAPPTLQTAPNPGGPWTALATPAADADGWYTVPLAGVAPAAYWRVAATVPPPAP